MHILPVGSTPILVCVLFSVGVSHAQVHIVTLKELLDNASTIIVGRVEHETSLDSNWSIPISDTLSEFGWAHEGKIFAVSVRRLLKGGLGVDSLDIIAYKGGCLDWRNFHVPRVSLYARKSYLFFLDTANVPSNLIEKYNLQGRTFFTAYWCGTGVVELNDQTAIDMLRETEDSLGITPPTPVSIIPLTGWIDSLAVMVEHGLIGGLIGDSTFVDSLHAVLNNAQDVLLQGDSLNSSIQLLRFDNMIDASFGGFDRIRFVRSDLFSRSSSDVLYLRSILGDLSGSTRPHVDILIPNSIRAGEPGFTLTLYGEQFESGATVYWNWSPRATTFISSTQVQATITSQDVASPDTATVAIVNPGGGTHGAWFVVTPRPTYTLTVATIGNGSVTRDPNLPAYDSASTVQLTAVPSSGYHFIQWSGSVGGSQNPLSLLMNSNKSVTATFKSDAELAEENTSSSPDATASNNARHLVRYDTYLHEVFTSGGGIFHRRSTNGGATWDQTHQLSTDPDNSHPCITTTRSGSVHVVWQRSIDASTYEVWHSVSQDHGESWSTPVILPDAGSVQVSEYQTDGTMPVIAELIETSVLVVVYCSQDGLLFTSSPDDGIHWESVDGISGQYNDRVRAPSLAGGLTSVSLVYDYAGDDLGPYSRVFNGSSWSSETSLGEWTDVRYGSSASVATDPEDLPIAAWSGTSSIFGLGKVIVFRPGLADNSWSEWYTMFGEGFTDWLHPSITYHNSPEQGTEYGVAIAHHTSWGAVHLIRLTGDSKEYNWGVSTLSSAGAWASITPDLQSDEADFCWTEQSAFPHQVIVGSTSELAMRSPVHITHMRRAVLHRRTSGDTLAVEFGTMKIVDADGDTSRVHFKAVPLRQRGRITSSTMWEYLGSDTVHLPSNARRLIVEKRFHGAVQRSFALRVLSPEGNPLGVLDTTSTSGAASLNIEPYAGRSVILRPHVTLSGIDPQRVRISVGDVFTAPEDPGRRRTR